MNLAFTALMALSFSGAAIQVRDGGKAVEVTGLPADAAEALGHVDWKADDWAALFSLYVEPADGSESMKRPPLLGVYSIADGALRFTPRFALLPGVHYRAVFRPAHIPGAKKGPDVVKSLFLPRAAAEAAAVQAVYPSADVLPENLLKFYLHFTSPMSRGEAYQRIHLLGADGKEIDQAFLELGEELWTPDGTRFTLLFDPGRIKRGLKPREDLGPVLEVGKSYTLVIDRDWKDANGEPLKAGFKKKFRTTAPDETPPDPKTWKLEPPAPVGRAPLTVTFPKAMDHALLLDMLSVTDGDGRKIVGEVAVTDGETRWRFTPHEAWAPGSYRLVADTRLEDLAGNSLGRTFEVDETHPTTTKIMLETVETPFEVGTKERTDLLGDPLPEGAVARLGTLRLRHGDMVRSLGFFADGKTLLSADWHAVHVWDAATGRLIRRFGDPHGRQFQDSAFSPDGSLAALTMSDGEITIWDARTGDRLRQFRAGRFPSVIFSPDGKTLAVLDHGTGDNQALRLRDATSGTELHELRGHQDQIHQVVFSQDGKTLISTGDDKTIRFWDVATGKESRKLDCPEPILKLAVSPDGRALALVYGKKSEFKNPQGSNTFWMPEPDVLLWNVVAGKETWRLKGRAGNHVSSLVFAPDSETLWTSDFQTVRSWNVRTGEQIGKPLEAAFVSVMAFTADGKTLATGGSDQVIRLWDVKEGRQKLLTSGHQGPIHAVAVAPDGRIFATAGADATIRLWDRTTGRERGQLVGQGKFISALAFTPDGRGLLSTGFPPVDDTVRLWDIATGKEIRRFAGISSLSTPDGKILVTAVKDGIVHFWEPATGKEIRQWPTSVEDPRLLHIAPDGRTLVTWGKDQVVRLWDATTGKELRRFDGPQFEKNSANRIYAVAVSPNGKLMAFGGQVNYLVVYDIETGKAVQRLDGLPGATSVLKFSPDSRFLASGDWDNGTVRMWELATARPFEKCSGHQGRNFALAFAPDCSVLLSGNEDTTALVWDLTGQTRGKALSAEEMDACWADLASDGAIRAQQAVRTLAAAPAQAVPYLDKRLQPVQAVEAGRVSRLIADLDNEEFDVREKASAELEKLGEAAAPACRQALAKHPSVEVQHRLEAILKKQADAQSGGSPESLRIVRALETLEFSGAPEARKVLLRLAQGAPGAAQTEEAKAALGRMER